MSVYLNPAAAVAGWLVSPEGRKLLRETKKTAPLHSAIEARGVTQVRVSNRAKGGCRATVMDGEGIDLLTVWDTGEVSLHAGTERTDPGLKRWCGATFGPIVAALGERLYVEPAERAVFDVEVVRGAATSVGWLLRQPDFPEVPVMVELCPQGFGVLIPGIPPESLVDYLLVGGEWQWNALANPRWQTPPGLQPQFLALSPGPAEDDEFSAGI